MRRKYRQLTREHRYQISALLSAEKSADEIAVLLGVHRSTVFREIRRGSVQPRSAPWGRQRYQPGWAHKAYLLRRKSRRDVLFKLKIKGRLEARIREKLCQGWSPQQISHRLKFENLPSISHEAIYRYVIWDRKLGGELYRCLRQYGHYRKRYGRARRLRAPVVGRVPLSERPEAAQRRTELGHWERDLVCGKQGKAALLTIVDRKSRYALIEPVPSRKPSDILKATLRALDRSGGRLKTMTNDNGFEFMEHLELTRRLQLPVFFTRPYAAWERGTNENTNGLLRQFYPKGMALDQVPENEIQLVEQSMNLRPRRVLGYLSPYEAHHGVRKKLFR